MLSEGFSSGPCRVHSAIPDSSHAQGSLCPQKLRFNCSLGFIRLLHFDLHSLMFTLTLLEHLSIFSLLSALLICFALLESVMLPDFLIIFLEILASFLLLLNRLFLQQSFHFLRGLPRG